MTHGGCRPIASAGICNRIDRSAGWFLVMQRRLQTAFAHRLIRSPLGSLLETRAFERIKSRSLVPEFRLARAGAAAAASVDEGVDALVDRLALAKTPDRRLRSRLDRALAAFARDFDTLQSLQSTWERAFWGDSASSADERVALERRRRAASQRCVLPASTLGFLRGNEAVPPVQCRVPSPAETLARWGGAIEDPASLYEAADALPKFEVSRPVPGPAGEEYLVRFASPSPLMDDTVHARVFEPADGRAEAPALIYASGLGMAYDRIRYWPEEDYMARPLARNGCRVILIESPWHGRRTQSGCASGEPYLATAPEGLFRLYAAQAHETAALIAWARRRGSARVGVGGVSLGGIVSQLIAGHCGAWPKTMRPDVAVLGASSAHIDEVALDSTITTVLGVDAAIRQAGWTPALLRRLRPLLDPPPHPGIAPDRVLAVLGRRDRYVPYRWARQMLDTWGVPEANILVWERDHFGVLLGLMRSDEVQRRIVSLFERQR